MGRCIGQGKEETNETKESNDVRWFLWILWTLSSPFFAHTKRPIRYTPTMLFGRSPRLLLETALSLIGGFLASFLAFVFVTATEGYRSLPGQLVAGDPSLNRQYPTTLNTVQDVIGGNNAIIEGFKSELWWFGVGVGTIVAAMILFKLIRRYV